MNPYQFQYTLFPGQIHFGRGQIDQLPQLLQTYANAFIIGGKRVQPIVDHLAKSYFSERFYHFKEVIQHVPQSLVDKALKMSKANTSDIIVAIGGGSAIGLAKALALQTRLPIIAVPTTYAG